MFFVPFLKRLTFASANHGQMAQKVQATMDFSGATEPESNTALASRLQAYVRDISLALDYYAFLTNWKAHQDLEKKFALLYLPDLDDF